MREMRGVSPCSSEFSSEGGRERMWEGSGRELAERRAECREGEVLSRGLRQRRRRRQGRRSMLRRCTLMNHST
jgi:hypothetical protein